MFSISKPIQIPISTEIKKYSMDTPNNTPCEDDKIENYNELSDSLPSELSVSNGCDSSGVGICGN
jgi:hypothetical protein